jgi:N-acetylmuramoyl-L-alanine amidase
VDGSAGAMTTASTDGTATGVDIEVPALTGKSIQVASAMVTAAGLTVQTRVAEPPEPGVAPDTVVSQWPAARALVAAGSAVIITYQPVSGAGDAAGFVVVIDAGHQATPNVDTEPIGPGSGQLKEKVGLGVTGAVSGPEYAQALAISLKLRDALVAKGVRVVMVRTTNNVDIANSKRAGIGNSAKADLVVRIHLASSTDSALAGIGTLYPAGNSWVRAIEAPSLTAARKVLDAAVAATGARSRGVLGRSDQSGFNYSTRPVILVECGLVSNAAEDRLIADAAYQRRLADGIAAGVMAYLQGK